MLHASPIRQASPPFKSGSGKDRFMTQYLRVRNWDKFQHYKDRNPPWIKLHRDLLHDYEFSCLQDASKLLLMLTWLLASQTDNKIPANADWIKHQLHIKGGVCFKELIDKGFLEDDSGMLATCEQSAMPETETETEKRERKKEAKAPHPRVQGSRLSKDWELPSEWGHWAMSQGMSREEVLKEEDKFKDYWVALPGAKAVKADWQATWRNWIRRCKEAA